MNRPNLNEGINFDISTGNVGGFSDKALSLICCCGLFTEYTPDDVLLFFKNQMPNKLTYQDYNLVAGYGAVLKNATAEEIRKAFQVMFNDGWAIYNEWRDMNPGEAKTHRIKDTVEPLRKGGLEYKAAENNTSWMPTAAQAA